MSFHDLPENWPDLRLDIPGFAADVADLVVGDRDRDGGCVGFVLTKADLTMGQPAVVNDVDDTVSPEELRPFLDQLCRMVADTGGALLFIRGRPGSVLFTTTTGAGTRWRSRPAGPAACHSSARSSPPRRRCGPSPHRSRRASTASPRDAGLSTR